MTTKARLFIGVKVSLATVNALNEALPELERRALAADLDVRWVTPATYHVTLRFIGWARLEVLDALRDQIARQLRHTSSFRFTTRGLGSFPDAEKARVIWAGVDNPTNELSQLASSINDVVDGLGFPAETRKYHPHVTLGRLKDAADLRSLLTDEQVVDELVDQQEPAKTPSAHLFSETLVDSVILYETGVNSAGSEYTVHHVWPLESRSREFKRHTD